MKTLWKTFKKTFGALSLWGVLMSFSNAYGNLDDFDEPEYKFSGTIKSISLGKKVKFVLATTQSHSKKESIFEMCDSENNPSGSSNSKANKTTKEAKMALLQSAMASGLVVHVATDGRLFSECVDSIKVAAKK